jgi:hypothetical protein
MISDVSLNLSLKQKKKKKKKELYRCLFRHLKLLINKHIPKNKRSQCFKFVVEWECDLPNSHIICSPKGPTATIVRPIYLSF